MHGESQTHRDCWVTYSEMRNERTRPCKPALTIIRRITSQKGLLDNSLFWDISECVCEKKTLNCYCFWCTDILKLYSVTYTVISEQEDIVGGFLARTEESRNAYNIFYRYIVYQYITTSDSCLRFTTYTTHTDTNTHTHTHTHNHTHTQPHTHTHTKGYHQALSRCHNTCIRRWASSSVDNEGSFPRDKRLGRVADEPTSCILDVKMSGAMPPLPLYAFMTYRDNYSFAFTIQ